MARRKRYHFPGTTHHVMLRGNDGRPIFFSDEDRCYLCLLIQEGCERYDHKILSYCFMTNHIHLAIQVGDVSLSRIMQNLSFRYTRYINWRLSRVGHLFQGRFKSIVVDSGCYLRELVRYIHLNPVRAGMVALPEEYRWSSHNCYLGNDFIGWITSSDLLGRYSSNPQIAVQCFANFVRRGIGLSEQIDFKRGNEDGILGSDDFIEKIKNSKELESVSDVDLPDFVRAVAELYSIDLSSLKSSGKERRQSHVRSILALLVRDSENLTLENLGKILQRSASGLSRQAARLSEKELLSEELREEIAGVRDSISEIFG